METPAASGKEGQPLVAKDQNREADPRGAPPAGGAGRRNFETWVTSAFILALGWTIAVAVYVTATPVVNDDLVDDWEHSRRYMLDLERIGGRAAVFGTEVNQWVAGLWQGRSLAYTIAFVTAAVALAYFLAARSRARYRGKHPESPI